MMHSNMLSLLSAFGVVDSVTCVTCRNKGHFRHCWYIISIYCYHNVLSKWDRGSSCYSIVTQINTSTILCSKCKICTIPLDGNRVHFCPQSFLPKYLLTCAAHLSIQNLEPYKKASGRHSHSTVELSISTVNMRTFFVVLAVAVVAISARHILLQLPCYITKSNWNIEH